jgi:FkbM family methyltransferase
VFKIKEIFKMLRVSAWPPALRKPFVLCFPFTTMLHGYYYEGDAANLIDYHILSRGSFEPGLTQLLSRVASHYDTALLLDVGANVGVHSLGLCRNFRQVIAVEPNPVVYERLKRTITFNGIKNIDLQPYALGSSEGKVMFKLPSRGNLGTGRVVDEVAQNNVVSVPLTAGDILVSKYSDPLVAVKIDVEGLEISVLEGLKNSLDTFRPFIAIEVLSANKSYAQLLNAALPNGYVFYMIEKINKRNVQLREGFLDGDLLACPIEKQNILKPIIVR